MNRIATVLAAALAISGAAIVGSAHAQNYQTIQGVPDNAPREPGRWLLLRNSFKDMPPVLVAKFDYRNQDGGYEGNYNRDECNIILDLVRSDNDQRAVHLDYWCIER